MGNIALLVVDVQNALMAERPANGEAVVRNIRRLMDAARKHHKELLFVRHDDGKGTQLEHGTTGWQIYAEVAPQEGEYIVEKRYNSAFHKTDLKAYLDSKRVDTLLLTGMQTEYCINATLHSAFDNGYTILIPEGTNTTFDNDYLSGEKLCEYYNFHLEQPVCKGDSACRSGSAFGAVVPIRLCPLKSKKDPDRISGCRQAAAL